MGIIVGLTGGIGSGKSTVSRYLKQHYQVPVVDADQLARTVVLPGGPAFAQIIERFPEALGADGQLNRAWLRQHILPVPELKHWLESVTHPLIRQHIMAQLAMHADQPYQILDAALLLETDLHQHCDHIVVVDALPEQQLQRVTARDAAPLAVVADIMAQQCSREERLQRADRILDNTGTMTDLFTAVDALHQQLKQMSYE